MSEGKPRAKSARRSITRRAFAKLGARMTTGFAAFLSGCASMDPLPQPPVSCRAPSEGGTGFDYVVVGSGAGGGPLAANLAKWGHKVLLLEAGGDDEPFDYQVPIFHARASEHDSLKWNYFVRHYTGDDRQRLDGNHVKTKDGIRVLYPRAGTLGGCTAHHAMITIYPHKSDWDEIARITGDPSWNDDDMRQYFERLERCQYVERSDDPQDNPTRHGFDGWLTTNVADPKLVVGDRALKKVIVAAGLESILKVGDLWTRLKVKLQSHLDPNDWRWRAAKQSPEGIIFTPLSTDKGRRVGTREYIQRVQEACPGNLTVRTGSLVTRVLFDDDNQTIGVEYLEGKHLYAADPRSPPAGNGGVKRQVLVRREVILSAGAFNSPQLLKLSGVGPRAELERHGIQVRVDLPGVGANLQDRYEVGVISQMKEEFSIVKGATFKPPDPGAKPDPLFTEWWLKGEGVYTTNGAIVSLIKRSDKDKPDPDLFIFGLAGYFKGYYPGYSKDVVRGRDFFTWTVLKAHTRNNAGTVTLRSGDPRDVPDINFRYFDEGSEGHEDDLDSVVEGILTARRIMGRTEGIVEKEILPGETMRTRDQLRRFVKDNAWGHHASCSNKMGPKHDRMAVVDGDFRVYGTKNLRVVDASIFPKIPGFFIVTSIYMISEKASDVIHAAVTADAKAGYRRNHISV